MRQLKYRSPHSQASAICYGKMTINFVDKALAGKAWYRFFLLQVYELIKLTFNILFLYPLELIERT